MIGDKWTPFEIEDYCIFQIFRRGGFKGCRVLVARNGQAPYKEKCPFIKESETDKSGGKYERQ